MVMGNKAKREKYNTIPFFLLWKPEVNIYKLTRIFTAISVIFRVSAVQRDSI